jgi:hypothetical protein
MGHQPKYHSVVDSDPDLKTGSDLFYTKKAIFFVYLYFETTCQNFPERFLHSGAILNIDIVQLLERLALKSLS